MTKHANPANALGPRFRMSRKRQIINWMGAVQAYGVVCYWCVIFFYKTENTRHVEESCTKVNSRNISGDVVDEHAICQCRPRARREFEGTIVNGGYQTSSQENTGRCCPVEKVMQADGCNNL